MGILISFLTLVTILPVIILYIILALNLTYTSFYLINSFVFLNQESIVLIIDSAATYV